MLYLIRNPLDVAVSFAHHSASTVERMVRKMADPDFAFVDKPHTLHNQLRQRLLTWSGHVTSWVDEPGLRVHVVRYEDMQADPMGTFTGVIRFCGLDDDPALIAKAVDFSRFERVQAQEVEHGFGEKMPGAASLMPGLSEARGSVVLGRAGFSWARAATAPSPTAASATKVHAARRGAADDLTSTLMNVLDSFDGATCGRAWRACDRSPCADRNRRRRQRR